VKIRQIKLYLQQSDNKTADGNKLQNYKGGLVLPGMGGRKGIQGVKTERWGTGMVICLE